jgi:teichuronic acid biosynthesis glycosyltransferase TuaC
VRILVLPLVFPTARQPNPGIFILRQAQALRDLGHELRFVRIVPYAPPIGRKWRAYNAFPDLEEVNGFPVRTIRAFIPPRMIGVEWLPVQVRTALYRETNLFRPDLLHAHFLVPSGFIAVRQHAPTVVTAHGIDAYAWPFRRTGLRNAAREAAMGATRLTAVSAFIAGSIRQIAPRDADVIWNGADERTFYPRDRLHARRHFNLSEDRFVIVFAGTIVRAKGLFDLVDALRGRKAINPVVIAAGEGPDERAISAYAAHAGVDLRLTGHLHSEDVAELFAAADVVTLPSHAEGLPTVLCEAMLSARCVVATTVGGIPEIIANRRTGLLVPPRDPASLRGALDEIAQDRELRTALADAAHEFARNHLTWRVNALRYDALYRDALAAWQRPEDLLRSTAAQR